jgi:hypothetical protein
MTASASLRRTGVACHPEVADAPKPLWRRRERGDEGSVLQTQGGAGAGPSLRSLESTSSISPPTGLSWGPGRREAGPEFGLPSGQEVPGARPLGSALSTLESQDLAPYLARAEGGISIARMARRKKLRQEVARLRKAVRSLQYTDTRLPPFSLSSKGESFPLSRKRAGVRADSCDYLLLERALQAQSRKPREVAVVRAD